MTASKWPSRWQPPPPPVDGLRPSVVCAIVFLVVLLSHFASPNVTPADSKWSIYTALSIIQEGNTDLDEYSHTLEQADYFAIEVIDGHSYSIFPVGTYLLAAPFVFVADFLSGGSLRSDIEQHLPNEVERFIASFIIALAAVVIYLIAQLLLHDWKRALLLVFIFSFCTSAWSTASRSLWQHGPSMLMLSLTLYLILLARRKPSLIQFASIPLAYSYVIRPTNSISVLLLTLLILVEYRLFFWRYLLWSLFIVVPFLAFNLAVYDAFLSPYYMPQRLGGDLFLEALAGNLLSPSRGLFVYSPILLFFIYGILIKLRDRQFRKLDACLSVIIAIHWLAISSFPHWWGGHSFGPRFFSDMIPYFIYFLAPAVERMGNLENVKRLAVVGTFIILMSISFLIHYRGANHWDVYRWNYEPTNVDFSQERLWDWRDAQFLRGII